MPASSKRPSIRQQARSLGSKPRTGPKTSGRSDSSELIQDQASLKAVVNTQPWRFCSICGRALNSAQELLFKICSNGNCQQRQKQASSSKRGESQRANISARWSPPHGEAHAIPTNSLQLHSRLFTTAQDTAIEGRFWASYLPYADQERSFTTLIARAQAPYQLLREITTGSPLIKRCAQAVAFANLGRENGDRRMNMRGAQLYNSVLTQARDMVATRAVTVRQRDDILMCCLVMCTYEILKDDTEVGSWYFNAYFNHVKGLCQVIRNVDKLNEPSASMQYAWREARLMAARSAMFLRQPVFGLERPPHWSTETPSLKLSDDVLDNMFNLARWFPSVDSFMKRMDNMQHTFLKSTAAERIIDRGLELGKVLMYWEERAAALYCNERRPTLYSLCSTADGELLNVLIHHWMICMLLHSQLKVFVGRCSLWYPQLKLPFWIDAWPYGVSVATAGLLFSHPRFGIWSARASHTPMIATTFFFSATGNWHTPEAQTLREYVENKDRPGNSLLRKFFYGMFANPDIMIPQDRMVKAAQAWYGIRNSKPWKGAEESNNVAN